MAPKKRAPKKRVVRRKKAAARPKGRPKARAKPKPRPKKKPALPAKPVPPPGAGEEIGKVIAFFRIPVVAVIKLTKGSVKLGNRILIHGHTTDLKVTVTSMQINHQPIQETKKGDEFGLKVPSRARRGDRVYQIAR